MNPQTRLNWIEDFRAFFHGPTVKKGEILFARSFHRERPKKAKRAVTPKTRAAFAH